MKTPSWLRSVRSRLTGHPTGRPARRRLALDAFEDRTVPATLTVGDATAVEGSAAVHFIDAFVSAAGSSLDGPRNIAFGPDGNLYVVSRFSDEVLKYDGASGTFLGAFVTAGSGGLDDPWALAFGPDGNLYVSGILSQDVLEYDGATGAFLAEVVPSGAFGLYWPKGLAFGPDGNLYVSNSHGGGGAPGPHEVLRFAGPNDPLRWSALPAPGQSGAVFVENGSGGLSNPNGLAFGPDGNLYVANTWNDGVNRYNGTTGAFIDAFVPTGSGGLDAPGALAFRPDGYLYVTSSFLGADLRYSATVLRYSATSGAFVDAVVPPGSGGLNGGGGLAFDGWNNLYVAAGQSGTDSQVVRFGPGSQAAFTVSLSGPSAEPVSVDYSTADGSATAGSDYAPATGTVTFAPGETSHTVLVQTLDDATGEPTETFTVTLSNPVGATIAVGTGVGTILDNETKFFVVNDAAADQTYEYGSGGVSVEAYNLGAGNTAPRGAASTAAGTKVWVVDANKNVYVYNTAGGLLGSWAAGGLNAAAQVEGIATNGTDVWLVDAKQDVVLKYTGAASRTSGSQNAASSFPLNSGNKDPKGIVTDGASLWVVNDSTADKVFKYTLAGGLLGSWTMTGGGGAPTGVTLDPTNVGHLWVVDSATDRVYQYDNAALRTSGSQAASVSFILAAGNTNPQDIADPPTAGLVAEPMPVPVPAAVGQPPAAPTTNGTWSESMISGADLFAPGPLARPTPWEPTPAADRGPAPRSIPVTAGWPAVVPIPDDGSIAPPAVPPVEGPLTLLDADAAD